MRPGVRRWRRGRGFRRLVRRCPGRRCLCWMAGCARCRRVWSVSCMWPGRGVGVGYWRRSGLTASRFVAVRSGGRGRGCIAPGIWCAGVPMGSCSIWGVLMSRSRSAGIASSWVRSRRRWRAIDGVEQAVVIARDGLRVPARGLATSNWWAMSCLIGRWCWRGSRSEKRS